MEITENQYKAFGFIGKSELWDQALKVIQELQEQTWLIAIGSQVKGEDRIHTCGQADGINLVLSTLVQIRQEAKALNGLTN